MTIELLHGSRSRPVRSSTYQVEHGLGLQQVDSPVHEGPPRELARSCRHGPRVEDGLQDACGAGPSAMALDLDGVLAGIAVRSAIDQEDHFVDMPDGSCRINEKSMMKGIGRPRGGSTTAAAKNKVGNCKAVRAGDPYHRYTCFTRRCGNGCYGCVQVHVHG
jgi:hypothetical protein